MKRSQLKSLPRSIVALNPGLKRLRTPLPFDATAFFVEAGLPEPVREFRFHAVRRWRFDYCFPVHRVALEVQGGIFVNGRHSRGAALLKEWEKLNTAAGMGWRVLFCQPKDLCAFATVEMLATALGVRLPE